MEATNPQYRSGDLVKARHGNGMLRRAQVLAMASRVRGIGGNHVYLLRWLDYPRSLEWFDEERIVLRFGHLRVFDLSEANDVA